MLKSTAFALCTLLAGAALAGGADGVWKTETNDEGAYLEVEIAPFATDVARTCGVIVKAVNASDPTVIGESIIENMSDDGDGKWSGGTIWAPDDDKTYKSKMSLSGGVLRVSGCVFGGLICRGQNWTQARNP